MGLTAGVTEEITVGVTTRDTMGVTTGVTVVDSRGEYRMTVHGCGCRGDSG
jgi:hypothetical protein